MDTKNEENLLKELSDDELVKKSETPSGASWAHTELLRRNTEALRESRKSSNRYSYRMLGLTLIVGLIAFLQLAFAIFSSSTTMYIKIVSGVGIFSLIAFAIWDFVSEDKKEDQNLE